MKSIRGGPLLGLVLLAGIAVSHSPNADADNDSASDVSRANRARQALQILSAGPHTYRRQPLNNKLSGQIFGAYLVALDPDDRLYNQADLEVLEKYRFALDDAVKKAALDPIYAIARVAQKARRARCQLARGIGQQVASGAQTPGAVQLPTARAVDEAAATRAWTAEIYARSSALASMGIHEGALAHRLGGEFCAGIDEEANDKERAFELFLDSYAKLSDGHGSYRSPFLKRIPAVASKVLAPSLPVYTSIADVDGKRIGSIVVHHLDPRPGTSVTLDVFNAIADVSKYGLEGIVLDLRGNEGGSLREVVDVAGLFIGPLPVMQIRDAEGRVSVETSRQQQKWKGSLAVLIDRKTAAGAEVLAAALQDHGRAILLGEQSLGSGTVQNRFELDRAAETRHRDGSMTITVAEVFRLNGQPLEGRGLIPDARLPGVQNAADRPTSTAVSKAIGAAPGYESPARRFVKSGADFPPSSFATQQQLAADPVAAEAVTILASLVATAPVAAPAKVEDESLTSRYSQALRSDVMNQWNPPENARDMPSCKARIRQLPGGQVVSVTIDATCPDDLRLRNSVEAAIIKASPLPYVGYEAVFSRDVVLNFKAAP